MGMGYRARRTLIVAGLLGCGADDEEPAAGTDESTGMGSSSTSESTTAGPTGGSAPGETTTSGATTSTATTTATSSNTTSGGNTSGGDTTGSVSPNTDFEEIDGIVVFEAEHFAEQTENEARQL